MGYKYVRVLRIHVPAKRYYHVVFCRRTCLPTPTLDEVMVKLVHCFVYWYEYVSARPRYILVRYLLFLFFNYAQFLVTICKVIQVHDSMADTRYE